MLRTSIKKEAELDLDLLEIRIRDILKADPEMRNHRH